MSVEHFKKPLSIKTKAIYYDNKGQVNVSAQRSFLKATEINWGFFLSKIFLQRKKQPREQGTREKKNPSLNIH